MLISGLRSAGAVTSFHDAAELLHLPSLRYSLVLILHRVADRKCYEAKVFLYVPVIAIYHVRQNDSVPYLVRTSSSYTGQ